jgi:hypothetical protein
MSGFIKCSGLHGLSRYVGDDFEIFIPVQNGEVSEFSRCSDDQVRNGGSAVLASVSEQAENLQGPVFNSRGKALHRH